MRGSNFFTGHSGSGKSTVVDALQIVLYADTDGRRFFNKAAADDSDRSPDQYLRGMVNIGENNQISVSAESELFQYASCWNWNGRIRGRSSASALSFDVETATNEIGRLFFWHKGGHA
ncbi:MAG: ATP-binding protein [Clostridium sp.]